MNRQQNDVMIVTVARELGKVPYEIKDVLIMVNCRDKGRRTFAGSQIISIPSSPLVLDYNEKMILLAEFVKRLSICVEDLMEFLRCGHE